MELTTFWFLLIGVLWAGYFLLEGFDFGVGILLPVVGVDDRSRRLAINTIGPVWDGNEVWLLVAGGATFAAFPEWYATLFSGFFLPLLLILVALIVRGLAFEYRGKRDGVVWRRRWDTSIFVCSLVPAILWGVAFGNILRGVELDAQHEYVGGFFNLLNPYALLGGLTTLVLFTLHGAVFLALKTDGPMREHAGRLAARLALLAVPVAAAFLIWTAITHRDGWGIALSAVAAATLVAAIPLTRARREGWAFTATGATLLIAVAALFVTLFPDVMPSTVDPAYSLTVHNASSTPYTLKVMSWVAVCFTPIVLLYQGWTYWVFRKRLKLSDIPA
ncbi:cytochrome d ubiquinol oxidase subunit II [Actinoplanes regularis]|uniref:Cytochrome bd-I ubiquinol oxidase subunit 2 apoprotein n=1 Tax=Actinoplanes regularis TaxID=52697 RepID=A0A239A893_9ACTN|nr:cytochrome d ubiquinol oxidase subunit II [Actinoplanes regularis]GIE87026.1 cytochrome c oxidase assembly protein [Actinoplanes regularis]GLW28353.1 cytochrome c oxidase assembly protein [Actinoplanes regularis]SNR91790.1 cytochrome bd-I ubiquinol oxidase subunit 2 apoprotein [Actinoplanes regularis]